MVSAAAVLLLPLVLLAAPAARLVGPEAVLTGVAVLPDLRECGLDWSRMRLTSVRGVWTGTCVYVCVCMCVYVCACVCL